MSKSPWLVPLAAERRRLRREHSAPHLSRAVRDLLVDVIILDGDQDEAPSLTEMAKRARALLRYRRGTPTPPQGPDPADIAAGAFLNKWALADWEPAS